ncbi:MAG: TIR domain-containing protein [Terriglobales bacterium]
MANRKAEAVVVPAPVEKRSYISQGEIPSLSLEKALRVATAIGENYGYKSSSPLQVAKALDISPTTGGFKTLTGASIAYGLTNGGYNADSISITPLGMRIVRPTVDGDDLAAKREALLKPRVIREFLQKYDAAPFPKDAIAQNVLMEMGVPQERAADALKLIVEGANAVGFLQTIKDRKYVELAGTAEPVVDEEQEEITEDDEPASHATPQPVLVSKSVTPAVVATVSTVIPDARAKRVFITHGKNKDLIEPIKKLLSLADLEPVVSVQTQTVSQPVPSKVMSEMRSCGAAIIHVDDERHITDKEGVEHIVLNDNVLIEIGAAMAIYGERFILIVKEGLKLPSNLSGLLELRYKGDKPQIEDTIKLIDAINDMKKRPLP